MTTQTVIVLQKSPVRLPVCGLLVAVPAAVAAIALRVPLPMALWGAALLAALATVVYALTWFRQPVLRADAEGIWTAHLGHRPWAEVRVLKLDTHRPHKSPWPTLELRIETTGGYTDQLDFFYVRGSAEEALTRLNALRGQRT